MKIFMKFIVFASVLCFISGCGADGAGSSGNAGNAGDAGGAGSAERGSFSEKDLELDIGGQKWGLMQDAEKLVDIIGSAEYTETVSCAYEGMDKMYRNEDIVVCTFPTGGKDMTDELQLISDKYSTSEGIRVGSSLEDVKAAYGENYTEADGFFTYWAGEAEGLKTPRMYFEIVDNKVVLISIYGARSAG